MSISLTAMYDRLIDFSSTRHEETTSIVEIEKRTDVELKIPNKPSSFIKAVDSTIKSFPTYLSDFAQPESGNNAGYFGWFLSVSDDGHTILVSDYLGDGDSLTDNGATWCFEYTGSSWSQKGSTIYGPVASGRLGEDLHLSGDGNTIFLGSPQSSITDLYIYTYNTFTSEWNTVQTISGSWGGQIRSNYDGTILIASEPGYATPYTQAGRALIYEYSGGSWTQKGSEITGQETSSLLHGVAMSPDGTKIAIAERNKGRHKVFTYDPSTSDWVQKGSTLRDFDDLDDARSLDLSDDANTLVVGAYNDDTNSLTNNGSIKIYTYDTDWTLVKTISGDQSSDFITYEGISLSGDGTTVGFSERRSSSSNLARIRVFRLVNSVWTEIYTDTINYDGSNSGITCKMSRDKSTIISHYRDTDNSNYRTIYLAHSYNNGYGYYANTDTTKPASYKSIRLMPSPNPKSGYLDLITDENENFEMNVRGNATIDTLTVNGRAGLANFLIGNVSDSTSLTAPVYMAHRDRLNVTDYAVLQNSDGDTVINAATGRTLYLRIGDSTKAYLKSDYFYTGHVNVGQGWVGKVLFTNVSGYEQHARIDSSQTSNNWSMNFYTKFLFNMMMYTTSGASDTVGNSGRQVRTVHLYPANDNAWNLGTTSLRWKKVYAASSSISTSDDRLKINETPIINSLQFLRNIDFYEYDKVQTLDGTDIEYKERGVVAQHLLGTDLEYMLEGGQEEDIEDTSGNITRQYIPYGIRYNDIFVTNCKATKELDSLVQAQQTQINTLTAQNDLLKSKLNELLTESGKETIP